MKTHIKLLFFTLILGISTRSSAQCFTYSYEFLDGNKVSARFSAGSDRFWDMVGSPAYEVPRGAGKNMSFAASMWVGGLDSVGGLHMAAATYRQGGNDFYAGPTRSGFAYTCGRGFSTPSSCKKDGAMFLSSGKVASFYPNGFQIYDPQTQTSIQRILPNDFLKYQSLELPNGNLMLVSWPILQTSPALAMVFDANGFPMPQIDTLYYNHTFGAMAALPTGKVLLVSFDGNELFDPVTHAKSLPAPFTGQSGYPSLINMANGKVFLAGWTTSAVYDPILDTWTAGPNLSAQRYDPTLVNLPGGDVLIAGGNTSVYGTDRYNPTTNLITAGPDLPIPMREMAAFLFGTQEVLVSQGLPYLARNDIFALNLSTGVARALHFPAASLPIDFDGSLMVLGLGNSQDFVYLDPTTGKILDQRWQDVWKVSKVQVQQFQQDFANNAINFAAYPDIQSWPGNGNVWAGEDAQLAPYIDQDNDGIYDPLHDGDYPCFPGDQALWWVFNDDGPHTESDGLPLGVQVENLSYIVDCNLSPCPDTALDYATFHHVEVTNHGLLDLHDMHLGMFYDFDLGNYSDDFVGSDSALGLSFVFNGDANDETVSGYGLNPPALGALVLPNGQIDHAGGSMYYENDFSVTGNPETASQYYGYLQGVWKDGSHLINNGHNGHQGSGPGPATNFIYDGDAGFCGGAPVGWTESSAGNQPFDRRLVQSFGPLSFPVGEEVVLDYALVYARQLSNDNLGSVCKLKADAALLKNWWVNELDKGCFSLITATPDAQVAEVLGMQVYPNPNAGSFVLRLEQPSRHAIGVAMLNLQGQQVWQGSLPAGGRTLQVETDGLPSGLYLLQVRDGGLQSMHKVVIAH
jgi:Secretion system C-terminal sorting domain